MANVKIKLVIDDSGALQTLKDFNAAFKKISDNQKVINKQFATTFQNINTSPLPNTCVALDF